LLGDHLVRSDFDHGERAVLSHRLTEVERVQMLPAFAQSGVEVIDAANAVERIAEGLDEVHERVRGASARILLENTAGQGGTIGA